VGTVPFYSILLPEEENLYTILEVTLEEETQLEVETKINITLINLVIKDLESQEMVVE
jgi:hypothetical protein